MMDSLRALYRWMLAGWLVLVLLLSIIVGRSADSKTPGNLLAFLFTRGETSVPLPPAPQAPPIAVEPAPPAEPAPAAEPGWQPLEQGNAEGRGSLGMPEVTTPDGQHTVALFPCSGRPGQYRLYHPTNVGGLSVDLPGAWGKGLSLNTALPRGPVRRLQMADHMDHGRRWLRVTGIARSGGNLAARVEYSPSKRQLRVTFTPDQAGHSGQAQAAQAAHTEHAEPPQQRTRQGRPARSARPRHPRQ